MYFDFLAQKFVAEKKAHFLCKDVACLPNGVPVIVTENGELYILMNRQKLLGAQDFSGSNATEMVRLIDNQGIKITSVAVASGVPTDATLDQMIIWGVSDQQYDEDGKGFAVYAGNIDISSGEPHIIWQPLGLNAEKVSLFSPSLALSINSYGQVFASRL